MAKRKKDKARVSRADGGEQGMVKPFAAAFERLGVTPAHAPAHAPQPDAVTTSVEVGASAQTLARQKKIVLRREKKGRGGKTVTRVQGLDLSPDALRELARELGRAMGCGAKVEADEIIVQGDQVARATPWFEARGVRRVVRGN